jgi:hypothetical protein
MFRSTFDEKIPLQGASLGDLALTWYRNSHFHPGSLLLTALGLALLGLPFLTDSPFLRPLLFSWVAFAGTLGFMLLLRNAGAGPHHTVLVYPAPQFIVAATGAALSQRLGGWHLPAFVALSVLIAGSGLWLLGQYYRAGRVNGFSVYWTDGLRNLAEAVRSERLPLAVLDWGIHNGLQIETWDQLPINEDLTPREDVLYVKHCDGYTIDESRWNHIRELLAASQLHLAGTRVIPDQEGRPIFCLFRLARNDATRD